MSAVDRTIATLREQILEYALALPEAWEDKPWGEPVVKVRKKIFVFLNSANAGHLPGMTVKLPESADHALSLPDSTPAGYGLGRAGWVSVRLTPPPLPLDVYTDWVEESYRTIAPKSLVATLAR